MPPMMRRRSVLLGIAASPAIPYSSRAQTSAPPSTVFTVALAELTKGRELKSGRIRLETSPLAESGSSVECKITVENALATPDQVRTIHLLSEQNPIATIARFHIAPDTGDVLIETSIRRSVCGRRNTCMPLRKWLMARSMPTSLKALFFSPPVWMRGDHVKENPTDRDASNGAGG